MGHTITVALARMVDRGAVILGAIELVGCTGTGQAEYVNGQCLIDGVSANILQVEARQAELTQHMLARQPILTAIAVAAVALAGAGYLQRLLTILAARRAPAQNLGERLRLRMERYRAHPVRYFLLLGGVLGLLAVAGTAYVSMDADKRTSERSLATLQFCHLALRSANEQRVLAEQREHLASIQSTEHEIRALVDTLPPAEQQKAHEIIDQLSSSLGQQRTMVAKFAQDANVAAKAVAEQQAQVERGLSKLDDEVVGLGAVPAAVSKLTSDVHTVGARAEVVGAGVEACNAKIDAVGQSLSAIGRQLDALASRPAPVCPVCSCGAGAPSAVAASAKPAAGSVMEAPSFPAPPRPHDAAPTDAAVH
jgi:hypothetical protein